MRALLKRRPSAAMIVAATALFVALGAGAYAAIGIPLPKNSVGGNAIKAQGVKTRNYSKASILGRFIANNQVKTPAIHNASVNSQKVSLIKSGSVSSTNSTTSSTPTDLGGPSVTVTVPDGGVVELFAQADISVTGASSTAKVDLVEPSLVSTPTPILATGSNTTQTNYTAPGTPAGVSQATRAGWITLAPPAGTYTFSLRYETSAGSTATFANRTLLARVTR